jgi:hypothetical protein
LIDVLFLLARWRAQRKKVPLRHIENIALLVALARARLGIICRDRSCN